MNRDNLSVIFSGQFYRVAYFADVNWSFQCISRVNTSSK